MKTLVLYSGEARSFARVWPNHLFWLIRQLPKPITIVVSVAEDAQADDMLLLKKQLFVGDEWFFEKVKQPTIPEPPILAPNHAGYPPSSSVQAILRQFWHLNRSWQFAAESVNLSAFDLFVRCRPDICFLRCKIPQWSSHELPLMSHSCYCPWWSKWGGQNDRFALMGRRAAEAYFSTFSNRQKLWDDFCPVHPETMLGHQLSSHGINVDDSLVVEFSTIRMDGTMLPCDVTAVDVADYARQKS